MQLDNKCDGRKLFVGFFIITLCSYKDAIFFTRVFVGRSLSKRNKTTLMHTCHSLCNISKH